MEYADITWSKKLGGWFPEAEDYYVNLPEGMPCDEGCSYEPGWKLCKGAKGIKLEKFPALTTDMVLGVLPDKIKGMLTCNFGWLIISKVNNMHNKDVWTVGYTEEEDFGKLPLHFSDKSLPNALCAMLSYLIDNNLIERGSE